MPGNRENIPPSFATHTVQETENDEDTRRHCL